jgi:hypothetical protein
VVYSVSCLNLSSSHICVKLCSVDFDTSRCRKSTDLSWDSGEESTPADGEDRLAEVRKATPTPQVDSVVEPMIVEATLVEVMRPCHHL